MQQSETQRDAGLDLFKTVLVYGMVFGHLVFLAGAEQLLPKIRGVVWSYLELVPVAGFMLALGYGIGLSPAGREKPFLERTRPARSMLWATYVSSLAFVVLVEQQRVSFMLMANLASMRVLFGYSEFLASYFMLYLLIACMRPTLVRIGTTPWMLFSAIFISAAMTLVVTSYKFPLLGTIISTTNFPNFPLSSYGAWFLIGIAIGANKGRPPAWMLGAAVVVTGWLLWDAAVHGRLPARFPPSVLSVFGPALMVLALLSASKSVARAVSVPNWVLLPGRNVLTFLVVSNLAIFTICNQFGNDLSELWTAVAITLGLMTAISGWAAAREAFTAKGWRWSGRDRQLVGVAE